jgi:hypothetical protein
MCVKISGRAGEQGHKVCRTSTHYTEIQRWIEPCESRDRLLYSRHDSVKQSNAIAAGAERREINAISNGVEDRAFL